MAATAIQTVNNQNLGYFRLSAITSSMYYGWILLLLVLLVLLLLLLVMRRFDLVWLLLNRRFAQTTLNEYIEMCFIVF